LCKSARFRTRRVGRLFTTKPVPATNGVRAIVPKDIASRLFRRLALLAHRSRREAADEGYAIVANSKAVFVVNDDPGMLRGVKRLLRQLGYDSVLFEFDVSSLADRLFKDPQGYPCQIAANRSTGSDVLTDSRLESTTSCRRALPVSRSLSSLGSARSAAMQVLLRHQIYGIR